MEGVVDGREEADGQTAALAESDVVSRLPGVRALILRMTHDTHLTNDLTQDVLIARRLPSAELGLHASPDYLARRGVPRTVEDLRTHDIIGFDRETPALRAFAQRFPGLDREAFALRADSNIAQLAAIRAGFGIGICHANRDPGLVRVLADAVSLELEIWIVMHEDLRTSARCRAVFDALVDGLVGAGA